VLLLYDNIINNDLLVRRINLSFNKLIPETTAYQKGEIKQLTMFGDEKEDINNIEITREKMFKKQLSI
jgi:hypothetical protein